MTYKKVRATIRIQAELLFYPNGEWFWSPFLKRPLHFDNAPPKTRRPILIPPDKRDQRGTRRRRERDGQRERERWAEREGWRQSGGEG